jgi:hypothetical protein
MMKVGQVKIDGEWTEVGIDDARALHEGKPMRCQHCGGAVHAYPADGSQASAPQDTTLPIPNAPALKHPFPLK